MMRKFELLIKSDADYSVQELQQYIDWAFMEMAHPYDAEKILLKEMVAEEKETATESEKETVRKLDLMEE